jgi:iron complex transport system ATP-binding protein
MCAHPLPETRPTCHSLNATQYRVLREARTVAARGATVVVVMHDLSLASIHAVSVLMLDRGRVMDYGPAQATLTRDLVRAVLRIDVGLSLVPGGPPVMHALPQ